MNITSIAQGQTAIKVFDREGLTVSSAPIETYEVIRASNLEGNNTFPLHIFRIKNSSIPLRIMGICRGQANQVGSFVKVQIIYSDSEGKLLWENVARMQNINFDSTGIAFNQPLFAPPLPNGGIIEVGCECFLNDLLITLLPCHYESAKMLPPL